MCQNWFEMRLQTDGHLAAQATLHVEIKLVCTSIVVCMRELLSLISCYSRILYSLAALIIALKIFLHLSNSFAYSTSLDPSCM